MQNISQIRLSSKYIVNMDIILGKGSTGCVYEGYDLQKNQKIAVKVIQLSTIDNEVTQYLLRMQKNALMGLDNPYVLKGLKILQDERFCFMVTQYCNGGTLKNYIKKNTRLSQTQSLQILNNILLGYQSLVEKRIVHRDLKPANIMLHNSKPKIIDFGYCQIAGFKKPELEYNVGSPSYMAPQSYQLNIYNEKTQIWAIGVTFYQCLTGKTLDQGHDMTQIFRKLEIEGVCYPQYLSKKCREILDCCLSLSSRKRLTCYELLERYFGGKGKQSEKENDKEKEKEKQKGKVKGPQKEKQWLRKKSYSTFTTTTTTTLSEQQQKPKTKQFSIQSLINNQPQPPTSIPSPTPFHTLFTSNQPIDKYIQNRLNATYTNYNTYQQQQPSFKKPQSINQTVSDARPAYNTVQPTSRQALQTIYRRPSITTQQFPMYYHHQQQQKQQVYMPILTAQTPMSPMSQRQYVGAPGMNRKMSGYGNCSFVEGNGQQMVVMGGNREQRMKVGVNFGGQRVRATTFRV